MPSIIQAGNAASTGPVITGATDGILELRSGTAAGGTVAVTVDAAGVISTPLGANFATSSGNVGIGTASPTQKLTVRGGRSIFQANSDFYSIQVEGASGAGQRYIGATNEALPSMVFSNSGGSEQMRLGAAGQWMLNTTTVGGRATIRYDSSAEQGMVFITSSTTFAGGPIVFQNNTGGTVGFISQGVSSVAYNTSSDYRLKNITGSVSGAKDFVLALKPRQGTWKVDGSKFVGFVAHEFAEVSPLSVSGQKDAVDVDGKPIMQGMQAASPEVMANLVSLVQEQQALIESLTTRLTALEGSA